VVGAGYSAPAPLTVSPGQVLTIFASGVGTKLTQRVTASTEPLPTTLAGISVSLTQLVSPQGPIPVPLLAVYPFTTCRGRGLLPCSTLLGITLQVPFELVVNTPGAGAVSNMAQLTASDDGGATTGAVGLNAVSDQIHVPRFGDTILPDGGAGPVVTHADGTLVSFENPATIGEVLVMYAVGLGATNPAVKTGDPGPSPAARTVSQFALSFDYRPNATPSSVLLIFPAGLPGPMQQSRPQSAWLVPGMTGLYQINFQVPAPAGILLSCVGKVGGMRSNLTVTVIGSNSFDGAEICVTSSAAADAMSSTATGQPQSAPNFVPNTIWFPPGTDISNLGKPASNPMAR
jgi:uncharacterized protein (TIGR03437 family)